MKKLDLGTYNTRATEKLAKEFLEQFKDQDLEFNLSKLIYKLVYEDAFNTNKLREKKCENK